MDAELMSQVKNALQRNPEVNLLSGNNTEVLQQQVARRFGFQTSQAWWWEQLQSPGHFEYGQADGLSVLSSSLPRGSRDCYLFLTDDNPPPWVCLHGPASALFRLLRELRFVECFFVDKSLKWILFDTHHNAVVGTGRELRIPKRTS